MLFILTFSRVKRNCCCIKEEEEEKIYFLLLLEDYWQIKSLPDPPQPENLCLRIVWTTYSGLEIGK